MNVVFVCVCVCVRARAKSFSQMPWIYGRHVFILHAQIFLRGPVCGICESGISVYICRCYYSACALSDTGDASLELEAHRSVIKHYRSMTSPSS